MFRLSCSLFLVVGMACDRPTDTTIEPSESSETPVAEPSAEAASAAAPEPAPAVIDDARFNLSITASQSDLRIVLEPRGEYEIETRYPYRLKFRSSEGLDLQQSELGRADAAELSAERAEFVVGATHERGPQRCSVEVDFAVCSESGCVPFVRTVGIDLPTS